MLRNVASKRSLSGSGREHGMRMLLASSKPESKLCSSMHKGSIRKRMISRTSISASLAKKTKKYSLSAKKLKKVSSKEQLICRKQ